MIWLGLWFFRSIKFDFSFAQKSILSGLIFSGVGDTLLMFPENDRGGETFFLLGLAAFLITHICYAAAFLSYQKKETGLLQRYKIIYPVLGTFLILNIIFLRPGIPSEMLPAVGVYSLAIVFMVGTCLNLSAKINSTIFKTLLAGVLLFLFSDTVIGIDKFRFDVPGARLLIMIPYLFGQYFIAKGALNLSKSKKSYL